MTKQITKKLSIDSGKNLSKSTESEDPMIPSKDNNNKTVGLLHAVYIFIFFQKNRKKSKFGSHF